MLFTILTKQATLMRASPSVSIPWTSLLQTCQGEAHTLIFPQGISGELEMLYNRNQGSLNEGKSENS